MAFKYARFDGFEGGAGSAELHENVGAIAALIDHFFNALDLAGDAVDLRHFALMAGICLLIFWHLFLQ